MPTEPDRPRHLVLTGPPNSGQTHWLCQAIRDHYDAGGHREVWAVTADPKPFLDVGLKLTNPRFAAGAGHWVSSDLDGVLVQVGDEISARVDTTTAPEHPAEYSHVLLALDDPHLSDEDTAALLAILKTGPAVGITVAIATSRLTELPEPLVQYLDEHADVVELPPTGHTLILGPATAARAALRARAAQYGPDTAIWLYHPADTTRPTEFTCAWRSLVPEDLAAMLAGARQTIAEAAADACEHDLVVIGDDAFHALHPDRVTAMDDLLHTLEHGSDRGVRIMLSAPDRDTVPEPVRTWFDTNPGRGTVIRVEDHGTR